MNLVERGKVNQEKANKEYTQGNKRIVQYFKPGSSTAVPSNVVYRMGKIRKLGVLKGRWLDCGCADGGYTVALVDSGAESAVGVDVIEERILQARKREKDYPAVEFFHLTNDDLPFPDASFDGVMMNEVLEHVTDEAHTLREIFRVLRPGGHLVIMSPNRWFPFEGHGMHIGQRVFSFPIPILPWLPSNIGQQFMYARNYWPSEMRNLVNDAGFAVWKLDFVWPVFEVWPWLPQPVIHQYRKFLPIIERVPFVRRFGVSVFLAAQKR
jgi:2-polyprenyl-3-methyl-5-hydroxy-6-metoxy-1,4-benzoquinol methylase